MFLFFQIYKTLRSDDLLPDLAPEHGQPDAGAPAERRGAGGGAAGGAAAGPAR